MSAIKKESGSSRIAQMRGYQFRRIGLGQTSVYAKFRGINFKMPIQQTTTMGTFKSKVKAYAATMFEDSDINQMNNDHLLVRAVLGDPPLTVTVKNDNSLLMDYLRGIECFGARYEVIVEEAIAVTVSIPDQLEKHALFLFPSTSTSELTNEMCERFGLRDIKVLNQQEAQNGYKLRMKMIRGNGLVRFTTHCCHSEIFKKVKIFQLQLVSSNLFNTDQKSTYTKSKYAKQNVLVPGQSRNNPMVRKQGDGNILPAVVCCKCGNVLQHDESCMKHFDGKVWCNVCINGIII